MKKINCLLTLSSVAMFSLFTVGCNKGGGEEKVKEYIVNFDTSECISPIESQKVLKGNKVIKPSDPVNKSDKKYFVNWTLDGKVYNFDDPVTKDITLVPSFNDVTFVVTFDTEGYCKEVIDSQKVIKGEKAKKPNDPTPLLKSKTFKGWKNKNVIFDFNTPIYEDITLTPIIDDLILTVTFDTTGFEGSFEPQNIYYGQKAKHPGFAKSKDPNINCYGWLKNDTYFNFDTEIITENITLKPATTSNVLEVSASTYNIDIDNQSGYQFIAKKDNLDVTNEVTWYSAKGIVNVSDTGLVTLPPNCYGGVDNIVAKYTLGNQDYYGNMKIAVGSFSKLNLKNGQASAKSTDIEGRVVIPSEYYNNDTFTEIKDLKPNGFKDCKKVTEMILNNNITAIPDGEFLNCNSLNHIEISLNTISIGKESFRNCYSLDEFRIPAITNDIGANAFTGCALNNVSFDHPDRWIYTNGNIPISIDLLRDPKYAAYLLSYYFNDSLWIRRKDAVRPLMNLDSITLELNNHYSTSVQLFSNQDVNYFTDQKNIIKIDETGLVTPLSIGSGSALIDVSNGGTSKSQVKVTINDNPYIGLDADNKIMLLNHAKDKVNHISLPSTYVKDDGTKINVEGITDRGFQDTELLEYIYIPKNIKTIGDECFLNCGLQSAIFANDSTCTSIGNGCFKNCQNLSFVNLPQCLTDLGSNAFEDCITLRSITIGENLKKIKTETFKNCKKLESLYIPKNVTKLGKDVFDGATALSLVYYGGTMNEFKEISKDGLGYTYSLKVIHCSDGDLSLED